LKLPNKLLELPAAGELLNNIDDHFYFKFSFSYLKKIFSIGLSYAKPLLHSDSLCIHSITVLNDNKIVLQMHNQRSYAFDPITIFDLKFWHEYSILEFLTELKVRSRFNNDLKTKKSFTETSQFQLYEIAFEDQEFGSVPEKIELKFNEILTELVAEIKEVNLQCLDPIFIDALAEIREYGINDHLNLKQLFKEQIELTCGFYIYDELLKRVHNQIPGNFKLKKTEFGNRFDRLHLDFLELIGFEISKYTDIEVLPISKGNSSRYFQPDDINLPYLSKIGIKLNESDDYIKIEWFYKWLNTWLQRFELGKSLNIISIASRDVYTIEIIDFKGKKRNIKDLGFGVSQIVSLLLSPFKTDFQINEPESEIQQELVIDKFHFYDKAPVFYLEEPESNLHPNWQSLLMELITEINQKFRIRFIIMGITIRSINPSKSVIAIRN
jgi:hypothetical protein